MAKLGRALILLLLASMCYAAENTVERTLVIERSVNHNYWKKPWIASVVALGAANVFDARSSMGRQELNPLLRNSQGEFSAARGFAIKSAVTGSMITLQFSLNRNRPEFRKSSTMVNFISAAVLTGIGLHNTGH